MLNIIGKSMKIALMQMNIIQGNVEQNFQKAESCFEKIGDSEVDLVCLPATFATGINFMELHKKAEAFSASKILEWVKENAKKRHTAIVTSILELTNNGSIYDTAVYVNDEGTLVHKYRRHVLWSGEADFLTADTEEPKVIATKFGKIGLLIGHELFFPETVRQYFQQEVDIVVCVANIFSEYRDIAKSLCIARANENQCFFVFCSSVGRHKLVNSDYMGGSLIAYNPLILPKRYQRNIEGEPKGVLACAGETEQILVERLYVDKTDKRGLYFHKDYMNYMDIRRR